jgi:hypothetical protein
MYSSQTAREDTQLTKSISEDEHFSRMTGDTVLLLIFSFFILLLLLPLLILHLVLLPVNTTALSVSMRQQSLSWTQLPLPYTLVIHASNGIRTHYLNKRAASETVSKFVMYLSPLTPLYSVGRQKRTQRMGRRHRVGNIMEVSSQTF